MLEKINEVPFELFYGPNPTFFILVSNNLLDSSTLLVTKLLADQDNDFRTLPSFLKAVRCMLKPECHLAFDARLKQTKASGGVRQLKQKARNLRDARIAHLKKTFVRGEVCVDQISFQELKVLRDHLNERFSVCSFDVDYRMLVFEYDGSRPSDIEDILDNVARQSKVLHLPEEHPDYWPIKKMKFPAETLQVFNQFRRRCGLPEA